MSDKTLVKLAQVLRVEVFQLLVPAAGDGTNNKALLAAELLSNLRQNIKDDIDAQFDRFIRPIQQPNAGD